MKVKLHWHGPQTTLKQRSGDPQTTLPQLLNGPQTTPKQRSNEPQTHWHNQLNQHILTIIASGAQTLRNQRWPGHCIPCVHPRVQPIRIPGLATACLRPLGLKRSKLLPGRSWLYWGASTPQKLSHTCLRPVRALSAPNLPAIFGLLRLHLGTFCTSLSVLRIICVGACFFSLCTSVSLSLSLSFTWSHSCKPLCLCPEQAFLRWMKQCGHWNYQEDIEILN